MKNARQRQSLGVQTAVSAGWLVGANLIAKSLDVISLLVLARFLLPADFGLIAMAMTAVLILEAITALPLLQALVRLDNIEESVFDTAFTLSFARGMIIAASVLLLSYPLANFYGDNRLQLLLVVLALAPIMRGLLSPRLAVRMREMDFRQDAAVTLSGKLSATIAACAWAYCVGNYWAIAVGTVTGPMVMITISYIVAPYYPRFSLSAWREFTDILGWNSLSQLFAAIDWQIGQVLAGKMTNASSLGFYTIAINIVAIPHQALMQPLSRPLAASFSNARRNGVLVNGYKKSLHCLIVIVAPSLLTISVLSNHLIQVALGEGWQSAAILLQWLSIAAILTIPVAALGPLAMSIKQSRFLAIRTGLQLILTIPLMLLLIYHYDLIGAVVARNIISLAGLLLSIHIVTKLTSITWSEQLYSLLHSLKATIVLCPLLIFLDKYLDSLDYGVVYIFSLAISVVGSFIFYTFTIISIWLINGRPNGIEAQAIQFFRMKWLFMLGKKSTF